jgi:acetylornithine/N-succinyldiaminopimelate aminotransferase
LCREQDVILIADEVQTGLGRTGALFASRELGLEADIITLAKPLAGGLPLAAALLPAKVNELIHLGEHGTTFGGGPVTTAVASRVWDLISDPAFLEGVKRKGEYLRGRLGGLAASYPFLGAVKGRGLLQGLEVKLEALAGLGDDPMTALLTVFREEGLLILRSGLNVLRIAPPLVISEREMDQGLDLLARVFDRLRNGGSR